MRLDVPFLMFYKPCRVKTYFVMEKTPFSVILYYNGQSGRNKSPPLFCGSLFALFLSHQILLNFNCLLLNCGPVLFIETGHDRQSKASEVRIQANPRTDAL